MKDNKYLTEEEYKQLKASTESMHLLDMAHGRKTWINRWMIVDLVLQAGLRVHELAELKVWKY